MENDKMGNNTLSLPQLITPNYKQVCGVLNERLQQLEGNGVPHINLYSLADFASIKLGKTYGAIKGDVIAFSMEQKKYEIKENRDPMLTRLILRKNEETES